MNKNSIFWCKNCLNASTRPRITFDENGCCNACVWSESKKNINWENKLENFKNIITKSKSQNQVYDCLIPVSGGKDGSYVSYNIKKKLGFNPLTVTIRPALETKIGNQNLTNFINSGYEHIHVSPDKNIMQKLNKLGFIHKGFPYYGWLISIHTSVTRVAQAFDINLIVYGEDGELEYGGTNQEINNSIHNIDYIKKIYLENGYDIVYEKIKNEVGQNKLYQFRFPSEINSENIFYTHWSHFDNWDPYKNYLIAKEHCGLEEELDTNSGTFTNFAQNDQILYNLHTYLMYLKFGFGRATQDAGIEIRRGSMKRDQGLALVKLYDGIYPEQFEKIYLEYFEMKLDEFNQILEKWVNKELFYKDNKNRWKPKFEVE